MKKLLVGLLAALAIQTATAGTNLVTNLVFFPTVQVVPAGKIFQVKVQVTPGTRIVGFALLVEEEKEPQIRNLLLVPRGTLNRVPKLQAPKVSPPPENKTPPTGLKRWKFTADNELPRKPVIANIRYSF